MLLNNSHILLLPALQHLICVCVTFLFVSIVLVQRPINLNVSPQSVFVPISHARIYPWRVPIVKPATIKEITGPFVKKWPYYTDRITLPYRRSDKGFGAHKKTPFVINFPTLKSLVLHRTNWKASTSRHSRIIYCRKRSKLISTS